MWLVALATACGGSAFEAANGGNAGAAGAAGQGGSGGGAAGGAQGGDSNVGSPLIACSSDPTCTPLGKVCDLRIGVCVNFVGEGGAMVGDASAPADANSADIVSSSDAPADCTAPGTGDPCHSIPRFTGTQVVDGVGNEFCSIPAFVMTTKNAGYVNPASTMSTTSRAIVRIGWSPDALHAHVHVDDPKVLGAPLIYDGDNVQFFIAGDKPSVGNYSGTDDGSANQLLLAPPDTTMGAGRSSTHYGSPKFDFAARTVPGGYEIELRWPWNGVATPAAVGKIIGLDLVVGVKDVAADVTVDFEYGLYRRDKATTSCMGTAELWCDDLLWCTPTLQ
jgi:hypothetical protein